MSRADPFYIVKAEINDSVDEVQQKASRFHGLKSSNPERPILAKSIQGDCASLEWQLRELDVAIAKASEDPGRFNLSREELSARSRWIESVRTQISNMRGALASSPALGEQSGSANIVNSNQKFVGSEMEHQQLIIRKQDSSLDEIEQHVNRIGRLGRAIGDELEDQEQLLLELGQDTDTTQTRLRATQKKMQDLMRKSGTSVQFCLIIFLVVVLVILLMVAFS